jgi:ferrous iron transport protein B
VDSREAASAKEQAATGTFGAMAARFDGAAGAFAYLLLILLYFPYTLLYFPCTAAPAAVYRETSGGWTLFVAAWTTGIAYASSNVFYQAAVFVRTPIASAAWIGGMLALFVAVILVLRWWGMRQKQRSYAPLAEGA